MLLAVILFTFPVLGLKREERAFRLKELLAELQEDDRVPDREERGVNDPRRRAKMRLFIWGKDHPYECGEMNGLDCQGNGETVNVGGDRRQTFGAEVVSPLDDEMS